MCDPRDLQGKCGDMQVPHDVVMRNSITNVGQFQDRWLGLRRVSRVDVRPRASRGKSVTHTEPPEPKSPANHPEEPRGRPTLVLVNCLGVR